MEEIRNTNAGQGLGIAGLVLGIIALIISFIPCLGMYALIPGVIAIILSAVGYAQASKSNSKKGLIIAALVISIVGTSIASWQLVIFRNAPSKLEKIGKEIQKAVDEEFNDQDMEKLEKAMEELEGTIDSISDENMEQVGKAASDAVKQYSKEVEKAKKELNDSDTTDD